MAEQFNTPTCPRGNYSTGEIDADCEMETGGVAGGSPRAEDYNRRAWSDFLLEKEKAPIKRKREGSKLEDIEMEPKKLTWDEPTTEDEATEETYITCPCCKHEIDLEIEWI